MHAQLHIFPLWSVVVSFLFFPIVFGPAGLILGAVAKSKGEEKAIVALVVSGLGLVVGMFLGFVVFASM